MKGVSGFRFLWFRVSRFKTWFKVQGLRFKVVGQVVGFCGCRVPLFQVSVV